MVVLGFILVALAVAAAAVLVAQNSADIVSVHGLGQTWSVHLYWVMVAGLIIAAVALLGLMMVRAGGSRSWRLRQQRRSLSQERKSLAAENDRLNEKLGAQQTNAAREPIRDSGVVDDAPVDGEPRHGLFAGRPFHRAV